MAQIMLLLCILSFSVKLGQISLEIKFYGSLNCKKKYSGSLITDENALRT